MIDDTSTNFFSLPSEVRNAIYGLLLLSDEPFGPCLVYHSPQNLALGLLRANKTAHHEASSLFYARNRFKFTSTQKNIAMFFDQIGHINASYIRHVYIDFPRFHFLDVGDVTLEDDGDCIITMVQSNCPNLETIKTSLYSTNSMELRLDALDTPKIFGEALELVDNCFRVSSSLQDIILEVYEDGPCDQLRKEMKNCGWRISATEYEQETASDWSFGDLEYFDHHFSDDDNNGDDDVDGDDGYDIENDSDFWRRAGD
ncbi:hypothetical protein BKA63DRAFT_560723 [Paraphoma chrysanthemicola]|nr:hypothetical protein BKA63DRAFT_560723 [Paraphoma chrysanthemicola]